jgi:hypothetical protein
MIKHGPRIRAVSTYPPNGEGAANERLFMGKHT